MASYFVRVTLLVFVVFLPSIAVADSSDWEISEIGFTTSVEMQFPGIVDERDYVLHEAVMRFSEMVMSEIRYQDQENLKDEHERQLGYYLQRRQQYEAARKRRARNLFALLFPFFFQKLEAPERPQQEKSVLFDEDRFSKEQLEYLKGFIALCPGEKSGYVFLRERNIRTRCFQDPQAALEYFEAYPHRLTSKFTPESVNAAVMAATGRRVVHTKLPEPPPVARLVTPGVVPRIVPRDVSKAAPRPADDNFWVSCEKKAHTAMESLLLRQGESILAFQLMIDLIDVITDQLPQSSASLFVSIDSFFNSNFPQVNSEQREAVLDKLRSFKVAAGRDGSQSEGVFYSVEEDGAEPVGRGKLNVQVLDRNAEFERSTIAIGWASATLDSETALRQRVTGLDPFAQRLQGVLSRALVSDDVVFKRSLLHTARSEAQSELQKVVAGLRRDAAQVESDCLVAQGYVPGAGSTPLPGNRALDYVLESVNGVDGGTELKRRNPALGSSR